MQLATEREAKLQRIQDLEKENEELKKRLLFYEDPHTPPSAGKLQKAKTTSTETIAAPKKRGAPNGHRGATRTPKEPDEIIDVIADLPPPQKIKITQYNRWEVKCLDCGHQFNSKHPDCPKTGNFGIFLLVYITMLKFHLRGVLRCEWTSSL